MSIMKVQQSETPDSYARIVSVWHKGNINVVKNITHGGETYFHVLDEPPVTDISGPDDIDVLQAYEVPKPCTEENVDEVQKQAVEFAKEQKSHTSSNKE